MKTQRGFTLIELLVSLSIFSAVMGLALLAFEQGRLTWSNSLHRGEAESRLLYREQWLRLVFEQSLAARFRTGPSQSSPYFYGNNESMRFLSSAPIFQGPGKVAAIGLRIERKGERWQLLYREKLGADPQRGFYMSDVDWYPLITDLKAIEFSYEGDIHLPFGGSIIAQSPAMRKYFRDTPAWLTDFHSEYEESIPRRVRITFIDQYDARFEWWFTLNHYSDVLEPAYLPGNE